MSDLLRTTGVCEGFLPGRLADSLVLSLHESRRLSISPTVDDGSSAALVTR
ncbi:hypothetical protein [Sanguibacter massiliensis]|uniref:hypothetical protein n=1 Tax=Sanguibacter massiliensis TaxID=1973217 RepID=UPI0013EA9139|nr:hypothetical protein [Sanguibacter massiliensis]